MSAFADGLTNGPSKSDHLDNDAQVWERPWTIAEMKENSATWSLAADSGLFLFLQDFSQRMLSKTHEIEKQLDNLIRDTKATDSCLHSVFNDFLMLSNTQFIENRVYDEEVEEAAPKADAPEKQPEPERTREQKEAELIPKMQEAITYGLKVLESAFEHLDIKAGNSDSEDEEVPDRADAILEPKDLYVDRPLPYLIGSQAFMEQDDVGLGDLSSDEMSVDSDRDSVVESEDGKAAVHSDEDYNQDDDTPEIIKKKSSVLSYDDDDNDEDSDIFGDSDKEEDEEAKSAHQASFADELAARIRGEGKPEAERAREPRAPLSSKKKSASRKEHRPARTADEDSDDMFKPPKMEDEDEEDAASPFGARSGLFSGGRGLFDDDDEGDLFSDAPKPSAAEEKTQPSTKTTTPPAGSTKTVKKIPAGVCVFPENSLFGSPPAEQSKENGAPAVQAAPAGRGLFDEDDDFFSANRTSQAAAQEKPGGKKTLDLFEDEDEELFSDKSSVSHRKTQAEPQGKPPDKKMPAGAVSLFGPGTQSLLSEGLKKHPPSTSEGPLEPEQNGFVTDVEKSQPQKQSRGLFSDDEDTQNGVAPDTEKSRGLFSDDEDAQIFPSVPKSQSKPETLNQSKKSAVCLFDDEDDEDLFVSAPKSKPKAHQAKASTPQTGKATSGSLFSDDEEQWAGSRSAASGTTASAGSGTTASAGSGTKASAGSGMKASVSTPCSLPGATQRSGLFDHDDDLFAPPRESSQKSQRVALLFEDDDEDDKAALFTIKPAASPAPKRSPALLDTPDAPAAAEDTPPAAEKSLAPPPSEDAGTRRKPAGAVSLFGGIDVFAGTQRASEEREEEEKEETKEEEKEEEKDEEKEEKAKEKAVSLFDNDEEEEPDSNESIFTSSKPAKTTQKSTEEHRSTGVFQDEALLFSHTQQKDNDPDVDLFSTSGKTAPPTSSKPSSTAKPAAPSLFSDDDEDDLFSSVKAKPPPPNVAEKPSKPAEKAPLASPEPSSESQTPAPAPVKPKDPSSRIGKLQASLVINPSALLPGAAPSPHGSGTSSSSGVSSSSLSPSPVTTPLEPPRDAGVSFDTPPHVSTLHSAHKSRVKGSSQRRPQSRASRQQSVQKPADGPGEDPPKATPTVPEPSPRPPHTPPSTLALPASTNSTDSTRETDRPKPVEEDLFSPGDLFGSSKAAKTPSSTDLRKDPSPASNGTKAKKEKNALPSIFDDGTDDLFRKVKTKPKKAKPAAFLEDDDEDLFGVGNSSTISSVMNSNDLKSSNSSVSKQDMLQEEVDAVPKAQKKHKEQKFEASLFDNNVDIFADLSDAFKPKHKSKTKGEAKSIFDDDMDDIFSTNTVKPAAKAPPPPRQKRGPAPPEPGPASDTADIFHDPLNALGGN